MDATGQTYLEDTQFQLNNTILPNTKHVSMSTSYETANYWSRMSIVHSQAGDHTATLDARQKAVETYRLLFTEQPKLFEGNLARELLELSVDLARVGRTKEAYNASEESRMLYMYIVGNTIDYNYSQESIEPIEPRTNICNNSKLKIKCHIYIQNLTWHLIELPR
ncbi:hypothetical protein RhiTH_007199 [Rhizoctonia solani]